MMRLTGYGTSAQSVFMRTSIFDVSCRSAVIMIIFPAFTLSDTHPKATFGAFEFPAPGVFVIQIAVCAHSTASKITFHNLHLNSFYFAIKKIAFTINTTKDTE